MNYIKHNLNTKSSAEAKLIGVYDILTQVIRTQYFLKEQGCMIHNNVIYQDNQSAIKLDNNGRRSISKRTRHINIRYYFITYRILNQEALVEFCPALDVIGDYFTKALQGYQFCRFRNIILGIHEDYIPAYNHVEGDKVYSRNHVPTTDSVNQKFRKHKVVH